jgi:hypothetical protein
LRWSVEDKMARGVSRGADPPANEAVRPAARNQSRRPDQQPRGAAVQEAPGSDWLTLADTVGEIQNSLGVSLYDARMEMFGELFMGVRKARGVRNGISQPIEKEWFLGQIGQQGVDWDRSAMVKYGVGYSDIRVSPRAVSKDPEGKGGLPKFSWDQFWVEIVRMAKSPGGLPKDRQELCRNMGDFCATTFSDPPGENLIRNKLAMLPK